MQIECIIVDLSDTQPANLSQLLFYDNLLIQLNADIKLMQIGKYQHYKSGNLYQVIGVALHTETLEELVIYKALYHSKKFDAHQLWVRPKSMFLEELEFNGKTTQRFTFLESTISKFPS